jgi:hypothetical protein
MAQGIPSRRRPDLGVALLGTTEDWHGDRGSLINPCSAFE